MMSCKKATEIIEKSKITKLSMLEVMGLRFHLSMCKDCSNYQKLSSQIDALLSETPSDSLNMSLDEQQKQKIIELIKKNKK